MRQTDRHRGETEPETVNTRSIKDRTELDGPEHSISISLTFCQIQTVQMIHLAGK